MLEVIVLFVIMFLIATCAFSPLGCSMLFFSPRSGAGSSSASPQQDKRLVPEDSMLKRHFLAQLQSEIEATLFPRPTDSVLQRHYDSLVAVELRNRLDSYR